MEILPYEKFLSPKLKDYLLQKSKPVPQVPELREVDKGGGLETPEALQFLCSLFEKVQASLKKVLLQREADRAFFDQRTTACHSLNQKLKVDFLDPAYETVLGHEDARGEVVAGPLLKNYCSKGNFSSVAPIPKHLEGPHVTLFGPPDDPKLSINAMNAFHRKLKGEPPIVAELVNSSPYSPFWGADDEDSKTPLRKDLVSAGINLTGCFEKTLCFNDPVTQKNYALEKEHLSLPIKRFPGLALPTPFLFFKDACIPLHLYDFALHLFHHWKKPEALSYYVPKLETTEEARYIHLMVETAEKMIQALHPTYRLGTVRLFIVLENPRAIFRTHEILDALHPYFAGASLGWHDYLASTARLFKNESFYRIPVKADPNIVIKYIKASHHLLAEVVGSRGGIKIGGMYGVLPIDTDLESPSFQITLRGFFKDVITQMKRKLSGYWVAHPDFVRIGLAIVEAWRRFEAGDKAPLEVLICSLLNEKYQKEVLTFLHGPDIQGLDPQSPLYARSLIVADIKESTFIANNHPDEIRYNVFQSLQYLTDWLSGNGCVALPAEIDGVAVRVMDDLATAERSRWEVWHEIHHGRFSLEEFLKIAFEELRFIRKDLSDSKKIVQVKWNETNAHWYPLALKLMVQLMTAKKPVEFASELLLPFTIESIRNSEDPLKALKAITPEKYELDPYTERFIEYFEACGCVRFAKTLAQGFFLDFDMARELVLSLTKAEIIEAASFHGDIGEDRKTLDATAKEEQSLVKDDVLKTDLRNLGEKYKQKFGMKFLISAKGKAAAELLKVLKERLENSEAKELENARGALWEITQKRLETHPLKRTPASFPNLLAKHNIGSAQIAVSYGAGLIQQLSLGKEGKSYFELASLSKTIAAAFSMEYFRKKGIPLSTSVNELLKKASSTFQIPAGDTVTLQNLLDHTALNLHYVNGVPATKPMPKITDFLKGNSQYGYDPIRVVNPPGSVFQYSGGGYLVLEHLLEMLEKKNISEMTAPFFQALGISELSFLANEKSTPYATGFLDNGQEVEGKRKMFPAFAAGAMGTALGMLKFLETLANAFQNLEGCKEISHETAVRMLHGHDLGSQAFMGVDMGRGVFTCEAGPNRLMIHQGANDGFRCLYVYCYDGPDKHKGFVILCNGDNQGVLFIQEVAETLFRELKIEGVELSRFGKAFDASGLAQEQIVNQGYKELLFKAFCPDLPEVIENRGGPDPLAPLNLAIGATIVSVSNQKFARAENLISAALPVFDPTLYGRQGKVMDSWETSRHAPKGDFLVLRLKKASEIRFISFSTKYHSGNHIPLVSLEAKTSEGDGWTEIVPQTSLEGHAQKFVEAKNIGPKWQFIRVSAYPDGGLTRLGLFATLPKGEELSKSVPYPEEIPKSKKPLVPTYAANPEVIEANWKRLKKGDEVDIASLAYGAKVLSASNEHYGPAIQVISPYPPLHMFDGFESSRSRKAGHSENFVIALAKTAPLHRVELDFTYFRNNNPKEIQVEGLLKDKWISLVGRTEVKAFAGNKISFVLKNQEPVSQIRVTVYPDGGINRVHAYGFVAK